MRILVTGGAGFIGSHLVRHWLGRGARVAVLDNFRSGRRENLEGLDVELIEASVEDPEAVEHAARGAIHIYHLAAMVSVPESVEHPELAERINTMGTLNVLRAARTAGTRKVVFASSSAIYGMVDRPLHRESDPPAPASPYALTKLAGEFYMQLYRERFGVPTVALRFFNVFGPRQDPASPYAAAVAIFAYRARRGLPLTIYGDGTQTRDFVYVDDVVEALARADERATGVFNVACGCSITINELAREIIAITGSSSEIVHADPRPGDVMHSRGDSTALQALGWKPQVPLAEGLRRTITAAQA